MKKMDRSESLLDKDWGKKIPDYITKGIKVNVGKKSQGLI